MIKFIANLIINISCWLLTQINENKVTYYPWFSLIISQEISTNPCHQFTFPRFYLIWIECTCGSSSILTSVELTKFYWSIPLWKPQGMKRISIFTDTRHPSTVIALRCLERTLDKFAFSKYKGVSTLVLSCEPKLHHFYKRF